MTAPDAASPDVPADAEALAADGLAWLLATGRRDGTGIVWPRRPSDDEADLTIYSGSAGIVMAFLDGYDHFKDDRFADAAVQGARALVDVESEDCSLFFGHAGFAVALAAVHTVTGEPGLDAAAARALDRVRAGFDGERWSPMFELLFGNAGVATAALRVGDVELAQLAVEPYLRLADPTPHGVNWAVRPSIPRSHNVAHGTLGIVAALAAVAEATGRPDLLETALAGAADVVARNDGGHDGFLVPHSDPPHRPDIVERYSYGWCNGPAGDAQVFRQLGGLTGDPSWRALRERCLHTLVTSGLPQRLRPGFWDSNGRCCGTAGVLAMVCEHELDELGGSADFGRVLVADLAAHATVDRDGARWSNVEHREDPSALEPRTGWAQGNAGIVPELLRYVQLPR